MKRAICLVLPLVLAAAGTVAAQSKDELAHAGQTYRAQCINCHQPPDLKFKTDVAWLDQVNRTG